MLKTIAAFEGRIAKVAGPARSGKTEALVQRCVSLLANGQAPSSIMVGVSTAFAAQAFRQRLRRALGEGQARLADGVCICTALDACVRVLDAPEAREATGRTPRILNTAEYNFLLEDMKTTGDSIRYLRKTLHYFFRQMAAYLPREEWAIPGSTDDIVLSHMERVLTLRGGMLSQEAPAICADYLKSDAGAAARGQFAHVLVDDFQNLSRAEQTCLCMMANTQIIVAGNPNEQEEVSNSRAYPKGFVEFDTVRRGVETFTLQGAWGNPAIVAFADALCDHGDMDAAYKAGGAHEVPLPEGSGTAGLPCGIQSIKWSTPEDELNGLTKYLRALMDSQDDVREARTCIVVPNRHWAAMTEKLLRRRGFNVSSAAAQPGLGGDPRNSARCRPLVAYTKLNLLAHPDDMVAWRSWCGFDHALANSDAWMGLQDYADEQGMTLLEALEELGSAGFGAKEPFLRANALAERWRAGQEFITKNAARRGFGLLKAIGAEGMVEFQVAAATMLGDETAEQLYEIERACTTDPVWTDDAHALHVALMGTLVGTEYDNIFMVGAVDGFVPQRNAFEVVSTEEDRERTMNSERRAFAATVARAKRLLVISHFSKAGLELAERAKMQVVRVKSENGQRMAIARPTCFLQEAGDAAPTTTGGQALLSEHGLN